MENYMNEKQLIEAIGVDGYSKIMHDVYTQLRNSDQYKNEYVLNNKDIYTIGTIDLSEGVWLHFEVSMHKQNGLDNIGFTRVVLTDNVDFILDRIIDVKNELFNNQNK